MLAECAAESRPSRPLPLWLGFDPEQRGHGFCDEGQGGADSRVSQGGWDAYPVHQAHRLVGHGHGRGVVAKLAGALAALDHGDEQPTPAARNLQCVGPEVVVAQGGAPELTHSRQVWSGLVAS